SSKPGEAEDWPTEKAEAAAWRRVRARRLTTCARTQCESCCALPATKVSGAHARRLPVQADGRCYFSASGRAKMLSYVNEAGFGASFVLTIPSCAKRGRIDPGGCGGNWARSRSA